MQKGYFAHIEVLTEENTDFRRVLYTGKESQLVLMSLAPSEEIGLERHEENDQFFDLNQGREVVINGCVYEVRDGDCIIVPKGAEHNIINRSDTEYLKLYTIYAPAHHKDGTIHPTKEYAESHEEAFDGQTSE